MTHTFVKICNQNVAIKSQIEYINGNVYNSYKLLTISFNNYIGINNANTIHMYRLYRLHNIYTCIWLIFIL